MLLRRFVLSRVFASACALSLLILSPRAPLAQDPTGAAAANAAPAPGNVEKKPVHIWSEGVRMSGDLFVPKGLGEGEKRPAILLTHGWGGVRAHLNTGYAPKFCAAGFVVLTFDYRGWGDSDSKLVVREAFPKRDDKNNVTVTAQAIREVVDPWDQVLDIKNALDFLVGEPSVDTNRIGIWGTSYSGGHAVYTAATDPRIKAVVAQVGAQNSEDGVSKMFADKGGLDFARAEATRIARGEIDPIPQGVNTLPGLRGTPFISKMMTYKPVDYADRVTAPTLIIDAENEELFDNKDHGHAVYEKMKAAGKTEVKYVLVPGIKHYGIYREKLKEGSDMAVEWFKKHLNQK